MTRLDTLLLLASLLLATSCASMFARPTAASGAPGWPRADGPVARSSHAATRLDDGRVLVTGGFGALSRADLFDPATDTWTRAADMPNKYAGHTSLLLADGRVFVYGGSRMAQGADSHAAVWDPATDRWIGGQIQAYIDGRVGHSVDRLPDGRVLLAGGDHRGSSSLGITERAKVYDPSWSSPHPSPPVYLQQPIYHQCLHRTGHASAVLPNGSVLLIGGAQSSRILSETERFVPGADRFAPADPMVFERSGHTATVMSGGRILVVGGYGKRALDAPQLGRCAVPEPVPPPVVVVRVRLPRVRRPVPAPERPHLLASVESYDPRTDEWSEQAPMLEPRSGHTTSRLLDGRILVVGGMGPHGALASASVFDPRTGVWDSLPDMVARRSGHTATTLRDGRVLVVGGSADSVRIAAAELWSPSVRQRR